MLQEARWENGFSAKLQLWVQYVLLPRSLRVSGSPSGEDSGVWMFLHGLVLDPQKNLEIDKNEVVT